MRNEETNDKPRIKKKAGTMQAFARINCKVKLCTAVFMQKQTNMLFRM